MHLDALVADLALIMVASGIVTVIFRKLKQPAVLGYILAGFLISPNFEYLPTVVDHADISTLADIGVIFLMFGLGLEFSFKKLAQVGGSAFTVAATVMAMMILVGAGIGSLLGWGKMDCIFLLLRPRQCRPRQHHDHSQVLRRVQSDERTVCADGSWRSCI